MKREDVKAAVHANARPGSWVECRGDVHHAFQEAKIKSSATVLPRVLEKVPALLFAGDQDIICNYIGLEAMIKDMTWNGGTGLGVRLSCFSNSFCCSCKDLDCANTTMECQCFTCRYMG